MYACMKSKPQGLEKHLRLESLGTDRMDMRIPPLNIGILLESNPLKSRSLVRRLAVPLTKVDSETAKALEKEDVCEPACVEGQGICNDGLCFCKTAPAPVVYKHVMNIF